MKFALVTFVFVSQLTFASGWNCSEVNNGYPRVKVINHTSNSRVPAVMVVSRRGGTILTGKNSEIEKKNLSNAVRYTVEDESYKAVLTVNYREGASAPLENGEMVSGRLVLTSDQGEGETERFTMECERYLKGN